MWSPTRTTAGELAAFDYGLGWFVEAYDGRRDIHHGGGTPGFASTMHRFVDDRLSVVVLTNLGDRILDHLALDIAATYLPGLPARERADSEPGTTAAHRRVFADLIGGRVEPERFTGPMLLHLGTATGVGFFQWYASHGALGSFAPIARERSADVTVHRYRVALGDGSYRFSFKVAADGRIAQIHCW
jgi:hypothetical protein